MHARFSMCIGLPVTDDETAEAYGTIAGIVLHPDTGKVGGFSVLIPGFLSHHELFLLSADIIRWGLRVSIRSPEVLSPLEDVIRLQTLLEEKRPVLGQRIVTETGKFLGVCADVQFNTSDAMLEWLFPRRWWRWGIPLPVTHIAEVRRDAIVVRDPALPMKEEKEQKAAVPLLEMPEAA